MTLSSLVGFVLVAGCGGAAAGEQSTPQPRLPVTAPQAGQRWESYAGIEFQVPADWGWNDFGTPLDSAWCAGGAVETESRRSPGSVNRWYDVAFPAIACEGVRPTATMTASVDVGFDPMTVLSDDHGDGLVEYGDGWVTSAITIAGVTVAVTDDDSARRDRIIASIRPVAGADANGCPLDSALRNPESRPSSGALPEQRDIAGAAICTYLIPVAPVGRDERLAALLASSRLAEGPARAVVAAVHAAPQGSGPDDPDNCSGFGGQMTVLRMVGPGGEREVAIRYDGGVGNSVDDGVTTRMVTSTLTDAVLTGPHGWSGSCVGRLLRP